MVADTYSSRIGAILQGTGNNNNSWGVSLNAGLQVLDDAIAGTLSSAVTGGTLDLSGSPPPAAPSQARYATLKFTGTLVSDQTVVVPNLQKRWHIMNATTGAFALFIKTTSGTAIDIPQGSVKDVLCDGSNVIYRTDANEIGEIKFVAWASVPPGYAECDGSAISRARNVGLFTAVGTTWGTGDGVTTFNLPNTKDTGRFLRSRTNSVALGTYQVNQNKPHTHTGTVTINAATGTESVDHTHAFSVLSEFQTAGHSHQVTVPFQSTSSGLGFTTSNPGGIVGGGTTVTSGAASNDHQHVVQGTTAGRSAGHTHTLNTSPSFTTDSSGTTESRPEAAVMIAVIRL